MYTTSNCASLVAVRMLRGQSSDKMDVFQIVGSFSLVETEFRP